MVKETLVFVVQLDGEYVRLYHELLQSNNKDLVHQKLVELGFHKLADLQKKGLI